MNIAPKACVVITATTVVHEVNLGIGLQPFLCSLSFLNQVSQYSHWFSLNSNSVKWDFYTFCLFSRQKNSICWYGGSMDQVYHTSIDHLHLRIQEFSSDVVAGCPFRP